MLPLFFLPFKLPAWLWLAIYFALQFLYLGDSATSGAAASPTWPTSAASWPAPLLIKPFLVGRDEPPPPVAGRRAGY